MQDPLAHTGIACRLLDAIESETLMHSVVSLVRPEHGEMSLDLGFRNLTEALARAAAADISATFIDSDGNEERVSYASMRESALAMGNYLHRRGVAPGDRVPMLLPTDRSFIECFFGIIFAGAIPCPIAFPASPAAAANLPQRTASIAKYLGATHAVTIANRIDSFRSTMPDVAILSPEDAWRAKDGWFVPHIASPDDVAVILCSLDDGGATKGVMLTHANVLAAAGQIEFALSLEASDVLVNWLPLDSHMGLIGSVIAPISVGFHSVVMQASRFYRTPATWLRAVSRFGATFSIAPGFAYSYAATRIRDNDIEGVRLDKWTRSLCTTESIDSGAFGAFQARFREFGLPENRVYPCWGLDEASVCTASGLLTRATQVRVVDSVGNTLPERAVGKVFVSSPAVMKGYFNRPEETERVLVDGWFDTGRVGFASDGSVHLTGSAHAEARNTEGPARNWQI